jgi:RHS repeat-associated protein
VRQLADVSGAVVLARAYDPYGVTAYASGASRSTYGFTGEYADSYIKLIYLRSPMYDPLAGRFLTKDSWQGDYNRPLSLNGWNYVEGNPINFIDPTGMMPTEYQSDWWRYPSYGIYFVGKWNILKLMAVDTAIQDVGFAFGRSVGQSGRDALDAFEAVYRTRSTPLIFQFGDKFDPDDCSSMNTLNELTDLGSTMEVGSGGITFKKVTYYTDDGQKHFARLIKFASMTGELFSNFYKMRNNVVHELGHLFEISMGARGWPAEDTPYGKLEHDMQVDTRLKRGTDTNLSYGFASPGYNLAWQQHSCYTDDRTQSNPPCTSSGEIFADQFLGWTYDTWETELNPFTGGAVLNDSGRARSSWMNTNMSRWLTAIMGE